MGVGDCVVNEGDESSSTRRTRMVLTGIGIVRKGDGGEIDV